MLYLITNYLYSLNKVKTITISNGQKLQNFHDVEDEVTSLSSKPSPDNFHVGQAIGDGSCFFDSFRQGLEQQRGVQVTVKQLRGDCKNFVQNNPPEWFISKVSNDFDEVKGEFVNRGITCDQYIDSIEKNEFWGRPEIEGRILCEKYGVRLHVVESNPLRAVGNQQDPFLHQLIESSGSKSVGEYNKVNHDDSSVLHIINKGSTHFEPLLDKKKGLAKQEQEDFLLAKKLQLDEILEYCNISKDSLKRVEIEKAFDELLIKNANGEIGDVVGQCVSGIKQHIQCSEEQSSLSLPRYGIKEPRVTSHQQQQISVK